jgi:hypothetical protein
MIEHEKYIPLSWATKIRERQPNDVDSLAHVGNLVIHYPILIDDREKAPYTFTDFVTEELPPLHGVSPVDVETKSSRLPAGDYMFFGPVMPEFYVVERKSPEDLIGTLATAARRKRFERELEVLEEHNSLVVVECKENDLIAWAKKMNCRLGTSTRILSSVYKIGERFPGVPWKFCDGRRAGELATLQFFGAALAEWFAKQEKTSK